MENENIEGTMQDPFVAMQVTSETVEYQTNEVPATLPEHSGEVLKITAGVIGIEKPEEIEAVDETDAALKQAVDEMEAEFEGIGEFEESLNEDFGNDKVESPCLCGDARESADGEVMVFEMVNALQVRFDALEARIEAFNIKACHKI